MKRSRKIETLFAEAADLEPAELEIFLREQCADSEIREELESLLAHDGSPSTTLGEVVHGSARLILQELGAGPEFDRRPHLPGYEVLEKIGSGGMGEVWLAEQTEPVRRKVALKVIRRGMDSREVIARFEAERQALALMDHPAISKVYDAGVTPGGRPYIAMEYVPGVSITEHCDEHRLNNRQRLELFKEVCDGVQHAHQKAVIHRDLKPSNVLVAIRDGRPVPKIIDFGVAKATAQKLTDSTLHTKLGMMIGTPAYMSPEQAGSTGQDIDTRADVYALGVILYELLVGALPFDPDELRQAGIEAMVRKIREEEPSKPSTRLSTLGEHSTESAKRRRTELPALRRELSGDLDWITLKSLEKDRTRRYGSPHDLAADIERYLTDQPVLASPPTTTYRVKKFVRRHTWGVGVATIGLLAIVVFAATMAFQAKRIASERDLARQAQADLETVVEFQSGMLSGIDPEQMGRRLMANLSNRVADFERSRGRSEEQVAASVDSFDGLLQGVNSTDVALDMVDENILTAAVSTLEERFSELPEIDSRLRRTIGATYRELGRYEPAEPQLERALEIRTRVLGPEHPDTFAAMNELALLYQDQGRYDDSEPLLLQALEGFKRVRGAEHEATLGCMNNIAMLYQNQGRFDEAEPLFLEALEKQERVLGAENVATLSAVGNLAGLYQEQGRYDEAESLFLRDLESSKRTLGDEHPGTLSAMTNLALLYENQGRYDEAEPLQLETLEIRTRVLGADHPDTLVSETNLAELYRVQGRFAEAEPLYRKTLETKQRVLGPGHPDTVKSINNLANVYEGLGRYDEAEPLYREAVDMHRRTFGLDHRDTLKLMSNLAEVYKNLVRYDEAEPLYLETLNAQRRVLGDDHPDTLNSMNNLAGFYQAQGRFDEAEPLYLEAVDAQKRVLGVDHPNTLNSMNNLAFLYKNLGRFDEAEPLLGETLESQKRVLGVDHPSTLISMGNLGEVYVLQQRPEKSEPLLADAVAVAGRALPREHWLTAVTIRKYGACLIALERYDEAETSLNDAHEILVAVAGAEHPQTRKVVVNLVELYEAWGKSGRAAEWRAKLDG